MNKPFFLIPLLLLALPAAAHAAGSFTGPAVGLELGTTKYKPSGDTDLDDSHAKNTADVRLIASYGFSYGETPWIGSIEGKIRLGNSKIFEADNDDGTTYHIKQKQSYSLGYQQGYRVGDKLMPYVRLSYERAEFKENTDWPKEKANGYSLALGSKYALTPNIEVGAEYQYTRLKIRSASEDDGDIKLKGNSLNIGVSYRF